MGNIFRYNTLTSCLAYGQSFSETFHIKEIKLEFNLKTQALFIGSHAEEGNLREKGDDFSV